MKDADLQFLKSIEIKYMEKIRSLYQAYVSDFEKKDKLSENVYLIDDWQYNLRFRSNTRALCKEDSGKIYLKRSTASEYVLVHEFIHRLSIHAVKQGFFLPNYRVGLADIYKGIHLLGFNEILTEWYAVSVTGVEPKEALKHNIYQGYFPFFQDLFLNENIFDQMTDAYFRGDLESAVNLLLELRQWDMEELKSYMNDLSDKIIHRIPV